MLALFVKVPTMLRLRKVRSFSRILDILRITVCFRTPHISAGHICVEPNCWNTVRNSENLT